MKYIIPFVSGALLALATFSNVWWVQMIPFVCIAPVFILLKDLEYKYQNLARHIFFGAWLLPVTYWYYSFMPWWLAVLASFGSVLLLANVFHVFSHKAFQKMSFGLKLLIIIIIWSGFTFLRIHLPLLENWWLPHLGYSVWRNSGALQIAIFGGEAALDALVLFFNALVAIAFVRLKRKTAILAPAAIIAVIAIANAVVWAQPLPKIPQVFSLQQMTVGGVDIPAISADIEVLKEKTAAALKNAAPVGGVIVVWPENSIPEELEGFVVQAAAELQTAIVYHKVEVREGAKYKKVVLLNERGDEILFNNKQHIAPDENGAPASSSNHASLYGYTVTAYVCYDMHYPDSVSRLRGADIAFVPINDAAYGYLQKVFHMADVAIHARQAGVSIVSASTNGPTMFISYNGVVRRQLPFGEEGVLYAVGIV